MWHACSLPAVAMADQKNSPGEDLVLNTPRSCVNHVCATGQPLPCLDLTQIICMHAQLPTLGVMMLASRKSSTASTLSSIANSSCFAAGACPSGMPLLPSTSSAKRAAAGTKSCSYLAATQRPAGMRERCGTQHGCASAETDAAQSELPLCCTVLLPSCQAHYDVLSRLKRYLRSCPAGQVLHSSVNVAGTADADCI